MLVVLHSTNRDSGVPPSRELLRPVIRADTAAILTKRFIVNPVQTVLDTPMTTVQFEQALGISLVTRQRCDPVGDFG